MKNLQVKREWATAIALQCLRMNSIGDEMQEGNGPAVWFELAPHVGSITVRVIKNGWVKDGSEDDNDPDYNITLWDFSDLEDYQICMEYLRSLEMSKC